MSKPAKSTGASLFDMGIEKSAPAPDESLRRIAYHETPADDPAPFDALLARYASGCKVRNEVLMTIWKWNDPLQEQIKAALVAAEKHGKWKAENF
jgi:hypothetical protein